MLGKCKQNEQKLLFTIKKVVLFGKNAGQGKGFDIPKEKKKWVSSELDMSWFNGFVGETINQSKRKIWFEQRVTMMN